MSDAKSGNSDPSMDDILASIRKIISDDEARAQGAKGASPESTAPQSPAAGQGSTPSAAPQVGQDDVLLLTDLIEEPPPMPSPPPSKPTLVKPPSPAPRKGPIGVVKMAQPAPAPVPPTAPPIPAAQPVTPVERPMKQPPADQTLVEPATAGVAASAFDRLSQAVQEAVPAPVANDPGPSVGSGGRTIEDMVKELLRPMLKEWLDKNLPTMVERFVEREIVRLTRR